MLINKQYKDLFLTFLNKTNKTKTNYYKQKMKSRKSGKISTSAMQQQEPKKNRRRGKRQK